MDSNVDQVQYFLSRIQQLESKYRMKSWNFHFFYENKREALPGYNGRAAVDYSEWAFLYENFSSDPSLYESPPAVSHDADAQKPETISGFCFG